MQQTQEAGYTQEPPPQQPTYQQPVPGIGYYHLVLIAIILFIISGILYSLLILLTPGDDFYDVVSLLRILINEVAVGLFAIGMLIGVFKDQSLHNYVKMAMIIAMALALIFIHV